MTWHKILPVLLAALGLVVANEPLYDFSSSPIVELTDANFAQLVSKDDTALWVVEYYADWCGHCQQFAPGYEKAANNLHGIVKFGAVNADKAKATTAAAGVRGFPTVKLYVPGTGSNNPYTKKWFKPPLDYEGARSAKPLVAFATGALPNQVVAVNDATLAAFKSNNTLPRAVLFTKKEETSPLLKALSVALSGRMLIGEARDTSAAAVAEFGVADFPTVFTLDTENGPPIVYEGELKPAALTTYLESRASPPIASAAEMAAKAKSGGKPLNQADSDSLVEEVGEENVAQLIDEPADAWLLIFGQPTHESEEAMDIEALAEQLHGLARVGRADDSLRKRFNVKDAPGKPAIAMVPHGEGKTKAKAYGADVTSTEAARKAAAESIPDQHVEKLSGKTMDQMMQAWLQATDARAFAMLFTDKPAVPPIYRAVASQFVGKLGFGMANINDPIAQRFNVQKAPTLLVMFPDESKKDEASGQLPLTGMQFDPRAHGKFSYGNIANFVHQIIQMRLVQQGRAQGGESGDGGASSVERSERRPSKDLGPIPQLLANNFASECGSKGSLCAIAMLDGAESNGNKEGHLEMLTRLRKKRDGGPLAFSWLDATCHTEFAAAFGIYETDMPTMVVLSPSKLRWAKSIGAFDAETLGIFGSGVASGRIRTDLISEIPALNPTVDCTTIPRGADAVMEPETDMGDDIMAEILEEERREREVREAELAAEGVAPDDSHSRNRAKAAADKSKMSELQRMEAELEECEAMDLLCGARRDQQQRAIAKKRELESKLAAIAKKKKAKKKKKTTTKAKQAAV